MKERPESMIAHDDHDDHEIAMGILIIIIDFERTGFSGAALN